MSGRKRLAWGLIILTVVGWPATSLTVFAQEPQGILGLSWFAIFLTAVDILLTAEVKDDQ
jgi:hypothetical protein